MQLNFLLIVVVTWYNSDILHGDWRFYTFFDVLHTDWSPKTQKIKSIKIIVFFLFLWCVWIIHPLGVFSVFVMFFNFLQRWCAETCSTLTNKLIDVDNYGSSKHQMKSPLMMKGLWPYVERKVIVPSDGTLENTRFGVENSVALGLINLLISGNLIENVRNATTPK